MVGREETTTTLQVVDLYKIYKLFEIRPFLSFWPVKYFFLNILLVAYLIDSGLWLMRIIQ